MARQVLALDYYREQDILYLRVLPLPPYGVSLPTSDFLVYISDEDETVVGFEILDFSCIFPQLDDAELVSYLEMRFDLPEAGLRDVSLREVLIWAAGRYLVGERVASYA
jgi:hypothetical protein